MKKDYTTELLLQHFIAPPQSELDLSVVDLTEYSFEIKINAIKSILPDLTGMFNLLPSMTMVYQILDSTLTLSQQQKEMLASTKGVTIEEAEAELRNKKYLDVGLCLNRVIEILPNLITKRLEELFPEVAAEAMYQAIYDLKSQVSFQVHGNLQQMLKYNFEQCQKIKRQKRDFPKRGGPRRQRGYLRTEREKIQFRSRVNILRPLWRTAIRFLSKCEYDPQCLNMLKANTSLTGIDHALFKKAYLDRRRLKESGRAVPNKLGPFSFALKQAALEFGIRHNNDKEYSFETLRKEYQKCNLTKAKGKT